MSFVFHCIYLGLVFIYTISVFYEDSLGQGLASKGKPQEENIWSEYLLAGLIYPTVYELAQLMQQGFGYFTNFGNFFNACFILISLANAVINYVYPPFSFVCKLTMIIMILLSVVKTFSFFRIFKSFSPIVTMLTYVTYDLYAFMIFFFIMILMGSLLFDIMQV